MWKNAAGKAIVGGNGIMRGISEYAVIGFGKTQKFCPIEKKTYLCLLSCRVG